MRAPRSVTFAPIGTPSRSLKFAIDFLALVMTGRWPAISCRSAVAKSRILAFSRPSPTPMLMTTFSSRGTWYGFVNPRSFMTAWTIVLAYISLSRGLVWPVPLGRPLATAAPGAACAPFRGCCCGWPFWAGLGAAGAFCCCGGAVSFAMVLALVDRFAAALADPQLASVGEQLDAAAGRLVAARADDQYVGQRQRALALDDAALPELLRRPLMLLHHVDLLDQHPSGYRQHAQHFAALAALTASDDRNRISPSHVCLLHQMTSGASEMILVNWRSRSSRATGPKMRVPTGFSSGLIRTTALRSKRIYDPSRRRTSLTVRTTTARATSPFFTVPSGVASLMATMTVSPSEA